MPISPFSEGEWGESASTCLFLFFVSFCPEVNSKGKLEVLSWKGFHSFGRHPIPKGYLVRIFRLGTNTLRIEINVLSVLCWGSFPVSNAVVLGPRPILAQINGT